MIALVAGCAALLQTVAYVVYLDGTAHGRVVPNPTSWLTWAYGTALVVVIEADQGIHPVLGLLPTACAVCSIGVAVCCLRRGAPLWPSDGVDRAALVTDLSLTAVYMAVSGAAWVGSLSEDGAWAWKAFLLGCAAASTIVSFLPTLRSARRDPSTEDALAWIVWTSAYTLLLMARVAEEGLSLSSFQFHLYPATCAALSAIVAWSVAWPKGPAEDEVERSDASGTSGHRRTELAPSSGGSAGIR